MKRINVKLATTRKRWEIRARLL